MAQKNFNISASLAVRKIVNGDTIYIVINNPNAIPLFQGFDDNTKTIIPNWATATSDKQPLLVPQATSARGNTVSLSGHTWAYNGALIVWKNVENGWFTENASTPRFMMRESDGALRIIGNLASFNNPSTDTLTYSGVAAVGKNTINLTKTVDVVIQKLGSSSFGGGLTANTLTIGRDASGNIVESAVISSTLYGSNGTVTDYTCKWYVGDTYQSGKDGETFTITRDMVNTQALVIAHFYLSGNDTPVFKAAISITDNTDLFQAVLYTDRLVDDGAPATVRARVINVDTGAKVADDKMSNKTWIWNARRKDTWESVKQSNDDNIVINISDIDKKDYNSGELEVTLDLTVTIDY